jgi:hypothetical protein
MVDAKTSAFSASGNQLKHGCLDVCNLGVQGGIDRQGEQLEGFHLFSLEAQHNKIFCLLFFCQLVLCEDHSYTTTPSTPTFSFRKITIKTAGSGSKTVNITRQPAIRHRSSRRGTVSLTMLTTTKHSQCIYIFYHSACPPSILLKISYNRGGHKSA